MPPSNEGTFTEHDEDAERALLGALLMSASAPLPSAESARIVDEVLAQLTPGDFFQPRHEVLFDAILAVHHDGTGIDPVIVSGHLAATGDLVAAGGRAYLLELVGSGQASLPVLELAPQYAASVLQHAERRAWATTARRVMHLVEHADAAALGDLALAEAQRTAARTLSRIEPAVRALDVDTFLAQGGDEDDIAWLVPGLLERQDRLILTAGEGHGKSTLMRQVAVQAASGLHPFTLQRIPPVRVLYVDLENSERQSRRKLRSLRLAVPTLDPDNLRVVCKVDGLVLSEAGDVAWLEAEIAAAKPDLLMTGPIYKMAGGDPTKEVEAKPAALALDALRARHDIAVVLEAHTAKAANGQKRRPIEPYGWSGWLRWPEFGVHLGPDGELSHWRGMREERDFPTHLARGGAWPWMASETSHDVKWGQIRKAIWDAGRRLSVRELSAATGIPRSTVDRILGDYAVQMQALLYQLHPDADDSGEASDA